MILYRITAPHFCAGAVWIKAGGAWRCDPRQCAPILRWMCGKSQNEMALYLFKYQFPLYFDLDMWKKGSWIVDRIKTSSVFAELEQPLGGVGEVTNDILLSPCRFRLDQCTLAKPS